MNHENTPVKQAAPRGMRNKESTKFYYDLIRVFVLSCLRDKKFFLSRFSALGFYLFGFLLNLLGKLLFKCFQPACKFGI